MSDCAAHVAANMHGKSQGTRRQLTVACANDVCNPLFCYLGPTVHEMVETDLAETRREGAHCNVQD
jgi:hypothetical protein